MKWKQAEIRQVADLIRGVSYKKEEASLKPKANFIKLLRANNINDKLNEDELVYIPKSIVNNEQIIKTGDILLSMSSGSKHLVGKSAISLANEERTFGAFCGLLRAKESISPNLLQKFLISDEFRRYISDISSGTNINNLKREHILSFKIRFPASKNDQELLSFKIDKILSEIEKSIQELDILKSKIATYKQSILNAAIRGKLVPQDPNDEPASVLLEKIKAEKEALIKAGKLRKEKPLPAIKENDCAFELPKDWIWTRIGDVTNYGVTEKNEQKDVKPDTWVLELEDIEKTTSRLLKKILYKDRPFKSTKNKFYANDVLYGKLRPYLDKVIIADADGVCTTEIVPFRGFGNIIPEYLKIFLKSSYFIEYANNISHGVNLPRLATDKARMAMLPLPPIAEQKRIVKKCMDLFKASEELLMYIETYLHKLEILKKSILKNAFEGKLI